MKRFFAAICVAAFCGLLTVAYANAETSSASIYGKLPAVDNVGLSPKGTHSAFIAEIEGQRRLMVLDAQDKAVFAFPMPGTKVRALHWASEDHLFIEFSNTENMQATFGVTMEIFNVLWINVKEQKAGYVFRDNPAIADAVFGFHGTVEADGTAYGYFGGIPLRRSTSTRAGYDWDPSMPVNLFRVNLANGEVREASREIEKANTDWLVDAEGNIAASAVYFTADGRWRLHGAQSMGGKGTGKVLRETKTSLHELDLTGLGRTPGTVLVTDNTGEIDELQEVDTATGQQTPILEPYTLEDLIYDPVTHLLIGAHVGEDPKAVFFDPKLTARWSALQKGFPDLNLKLVAWSGGLDDVVVRTDGSDDSGTFYKVSLKTGATKVVGYAYPTVRKGRVGSTQMFKYKAQDGLDLGGVLTLPASRSAKNLPVVVMPHGGPIGPYDKIGFDWWAQAYADAGYAVFQPNYRGSGGYSAKFRDAGYGEWGGKMLSDIADGLKALATAGTVDPKRACIVGGSYGGYAALAGVTVQQGLYKCSVSVAGVADMGSFYSWVVARRGRQTSSTRFYRAAMGAVGGNQKVMAEISPATYASRADAPVLLIHGEDDTVVPISQSRLMLDALKSADKPVEFVTMKSEDHWLSSEATRIEMLTHALAFVKKHNPPD